MYGYVGKTINNKIFVWMRPVKTALGKMENIMGKIYYDRSKNRLFI